MLTTAKRKRTHKSASERQAEILRAATSSFARHGYERTDVQTVAEAAGIGKGTVYRHFTSKEGLFTATLHYNLQAMKKVVEKARDSHSDPLDQLRESMRAHFEHTEQHPELTELLVQERIAFRERQQSLYFLYALDGQGEWTEVFNQLARQYRIRAASIQDVMDAWADLIHGAAILARSPLPRRPLSERVDGLFDIFLHGILPKH